MHLVVGVDGYLLAEPPPAVSLCLDLYGKFSLSAGRDLSRVRNSGAPSPGFDLFDL